MKHLLALVLAFCLSAAAQAAPDVTFGWGDQPAGTPPISGYRIYQILTTADPVGGEVVTYQQANTQPIPPEARTWTTSRAEPGTVWTIRAWNIAGEAPDSDHFTIPAIPAPVPGFKALTLIVESSPDMIRWGAEAVLAVAAVPPARFFRLSW